METETLDRMKKVTITCDVCHKEIDDEHIKIGSETGEDFCFSNYLRSKEIGCKGKMGKYRDLHFCSKEHFIKYFFNHSDEYLLGPPKGFNPLNLMIPEDGRVCDCVAESGEKVKATYRKFKSFKGGKFVKNNKEIEVKYWKYENN